MSLALSLCDWNLEPGGAFLPACFFFRCEDQEKGSSLPYRTFVTAPCYLAVTWERCRTVVLVVHLVSRHSCVANRLPVVVRFPAGPRVRLKTVDPPKGNGLGQKKRLGKGAALKF